MNDRSAARLPYERVPRTIQDLSARSTNRHDREHDREIKSVRRQSSEKLSLDRDGAHLSVFTAEMDSRSIDGSLEAGHCLLSTGGRLGECDDGLRTKAETGESETTYGKAIAGDVSPFGICLKRRLERLHGRWWWRRLFKDGRPGRAQLAYDKKANRETYHHDQDE